MPATSQKCTPNSKPKQANRFSNTNCTTDPDSATKTVNCHIVVKLMNLRCATQLKPRIKNTSEPKQEALSGWKNGSDRLSTPERRKTERLEGRQAETLEGWNFPAVTLRHQAYTASHCAWHSHCAAPALHLAQATPKHGNPPEARKNSF